MDLAEHLALPDQHLEPSVAAHYDSGSADRFGAEAVGAPISLLAELAGDGVAVEFAVGTGRIALPLAASGVKVLGIDFSEPMLEQLRSKDDANRVAVTVGDMTSTRVCSDASLVYLVYNTIGNLRSQQEQVACFRNAAAHLRPGGRFLIETGVPRLRRLPPGETILPFDVSPHHLGFDEYIDLAEQILVSHHYFVEDGRARTLAGAFRYVWPSELDLMAELAGMRLESRWSGWNREPFTGESESHVSVWKTVH